LAIADCRLAAVVPIVCFFELSGMVRGKQQSEKSAAVVPTVCFFELSGTVGQIGKAPKAPIGNWQSEIGNNMNWQ
jgi:hypothetical protein